MSKEEDEEAKKPTSKKPIANCSIITGPTTIDTIAGPIFEWACIPENLPKHPTMAFFGKRRTGKSTTITNIAYHCCQNIPFGLVVSLFHISFYQTHRCVFAQHMRTAFTLNGANTKLPRHIDL